jgi:pimeloyl-ACP methyl ester carboxylesterase
VCDPPFTETKGPTVDVRARRRVPGESSSISKPKPRLNVRWIQNDNYLEPKTKPFLPNKPLVDPSDFTDFIFPQSMSQPVTAESPLEYHPPTHPTPGLPATKRMYLTRLYYQLGEWLDYYTGDHTLSARLRQLRSSSPSAPGTELPSVLDLAKVGEAIGKKNIGLFPQFGVSGDWPPTLLVHGSEDGQVQVLESKCLAEGLKSVGVERELIVVEGQGHSFDYTLNAEREFGGLFDQVAAFLVRNLW